MTCTMLTVLRVLATFILCGLAIGFACRNFVGVLAKVIVSLVLCALALVLIALVFAAIEILGWFVFAAVCLFLAWKMLKWIKGR